ncbi:MAG TPA: hypothetical protein VMH01_13855 [Puia sp.]|nr:hypothetical protein [Puia sp.]
MRKAGLIFTILLTLLVNAHTQNSLLPSFRSNRSIADLYYSDGGAKGTRYLFGNDWVKGIVLLENNDLVSNDSLRFNMDKISQTLFITRDLRTIEEIDKKEFKAVTFYQNDSVYVFEHVNLINDKKLFQLIIKSETHYSLFKLLHTGLKKVYYTSKDPKEGERNYDEFVDAPEYYIIFPNKEIRSFFNLKKNAVERIFTLHQDVDRVRAYLANYSGDKIDESSLKNLILYLNN